LTKPVSARDRTPSIAREAVPTSVIAERKDAALRADRATAEIMQQPLTSKERQRGKGNVNCEGAFAKNCYATGGAVAAVPAGDTAKGVRD
jgi:hypothetical protein